MKKLVLILLVAIAVGGTALLCVLIAQRVSSVQISQPEEKPIQQAVQPSAVDQDPIVRTGFIQNFEPIHENQPNQVKDSSQLIVSYRSDSSENTRPAVVQNTAVRQRLVEGIEAYNKEDYQTALRKWTEAHQIDPNDPDINLALRKVKEVLEKENAN
ncbi:MAG: hypothetical protein J6U96_00950 [Elusimicrobiaceae bacterium]|nr:hypothetical protein [Elusimicrobiaceae bacterium]